MGFYDPKLEVKKGSTEYTDALCASNGRRVDYHIDHVVLDHLPISNRSWTSISGFQDGCQSQFRRRLRSPCRECAVAVWRSHWAQAACDWCEGSPSQRVDDIVVDSLCQMYRRRWFRGICTTRLPHHCLCHTWNDTIGRHSAHSSSRSCRYLQHPWTSPQVTPLGRTAAEQRCRPLD